MGVLKRVEVPDLTKGRIYRTSHGLYFQHRLHDHSVFIICPDCATDRRDSRNGYSLITAITCLCDKRYAGTMPFLIDANPAKAREVIESFLDELDVDPLTAVLEADKILRSLRHQIGLARSGVDRRPTRERREEKKRERARREGYASQMELHRSRVSWHIQRNSNTPEKPQ